MAISTPLRHSLLVLICAPLACTFPVKSGDNPLDSTTDDPDTATSDEPSTGTTPTTEPMTSTTTGEASTGSADDVTGSSISISTSEAGSTGTTVVTADTVTGTTEGTTGELSPGLCRSDVDCSVGEEESCFAPGEPNCGACRGPETPCMFDMTCEQGLVCVPFVAECDCNGGLGACVPVCDADSCGREASCNFMTGVCEPFTCSEDGVTCPPLFECVPGSGGDECQRKTCKSDAECGGMPCVKGGCHEDFGVCHQPAP